MSNANREGELRYDTLQTLGTKRNWKWEKVQGDRNSVVCTIKTYKAVACLLVLQKVYGLSSFSSQASRVSISAYYHSSWRKRTAEGRRNSGADRIRES